MILYHGSNVIVQKPDTLHSRKKVFNTVELFFDGLIDKTEALKRLKFEKPNYQICFRSQKVIDECIVFLESEKL